MTGDLIMDGQGFSPLTKIVFLVLALLPAGYLLHEYWNAPAEAAQTQPVTFFETLVRITVGIVGFLAFVLLIHGGKKPSRSRKSAAIQWFACPCCGHRMQRSPEEIGSRTACSACDNEFELTTQAAITQQTGGEEDVKKWLDHLAESRHKSGGQR